MDAKLGARFNNDLHCVNLLPSRMYKRREYLLEIKTNGVPILEAVPLWAHNNSFITRPKEHLTNRGEVYLHFLNQAYQKPTSRWNVGANMYFSASQEEKKNPDHACYGLPTYNEIALLEDVTDPKLGLYLNPLGKHFDGEWCKYDENGYFRKLDSYQKFINKEDQNVDKE